MNTNLATPSNVPATDIKDINPLNVIALCLANALIAEWIFESFFGSQEIFVSTGRVVIVFFALFTIHRFAALSLQKYRPSTRDFICLQAILSFALFLIGGGDFLAQALAQYSSSLKIIGEIKPQTFYFAIPFAAGGLIIQSLLGLHYSLVFTFCLTLILCLYIPDPQLFIPFVVVTNLVACLSLTRLRTRSAYLKAGLHIAIVTLPFMLVSLLNLESAGLSEVLFKLGGALIGGFLCAFISAGVVPMIESVGGYVTDIRLIEMATLDHPLLKELSIQAPGTWNHSMVIGMMAEAGADAIGANPILARVGAYFHDVGKTKKPLYFVENQLPGENRHDKLSPSMSALIIRSHVKDGIELARKHKLPEILIDMIPQHHGTSKIEYFYDKAKKEAEETEESTEVDESLYRYPGPKPQTKEAGLLMLADGIEAAARTLNDPSHDRIQGLVQKMMNRVFTSGQLNECDLTLADLHKIARCFTRVLTGIYHQRIAYHEPAEKTANVNSNDTTEKDVRSESLSKEARDKSETDSHSAENIPENLKRLGME